MERQDGCHDGWPPAMVPAHVSISGHGLTGPRLGGPAARPLYPSLAFVFGLQDLQVLLVRSRPALTPLAAGPLLARGRPGALIWSGRQVVLLTAAWRGRCEPGIAGGVRWGRAAPPPAAGSPGSVERGQRLPRLLAQPAPNAPLSAFGRDGTRCRCWPCGPAARPSASANPVSGSGGYAASRAAGERAERGRPPVLPRSRHGRPRGLCLCRESSVTDTRRR